MQGMIPLDNQSNYQESCGRKTKLNCQCVFVLSYWQCCLIHTVWADLGSSMHAHVQNREFNGRQALQQVAA